MNKIKNMLISLFAYLYDKITEWVLGICKIPALIKNALFCSCSNEYHQFRRWLKRTKYRFLLFDGFWSVPLGFFLFFFFGLLLSTAFGMAVGQYDLAFIQPLFLAGTVVVGATNMSVLGLKFTFRELFKYLYGDSDQYFQGKPVNKSKIDFHSLTPIQRLWLALFLFCFFVVCILTVYLNLV